MLALKQIARQVCPPILWDALRAAAGHRSPRAQPRTADAPPEADYVQRLGTSPDHQDLDLYWDDEYAKTLDTWGEGNTWHEIPFLIANCSGNVLDIACGTGITMEKLAFIPQVTLYGCDISDLLIQKAIDRGLPPERLKVLDATSTDYADNFFNHAYSIGSLEHFTEEGLRLAIAECHRVTRFSAFHLMPVSRSGRDEGWLKTIQSFHNNSTDWWLRMLRTSYESVYTIDSLWQDEISVGKWFICEKMPQRPG